MVKRKAIEAKKVMIATELAGIDTTMTAGIFYHRLASQVHKAQKSVCGEVPAGGFRIISEEEYLRHPCPDCLRKEWKK